MRHTFLARTQFRLDLDARVDEYFQRSGASRRDVPGMYLKTAIILLWVGAAYAGLVFVAPAWWISLPLAVVLGLGMAAVGMNIQHDGGHGAYSSRPLVNRLMALTLDLCGGSSYFWSYKHNVAHHTYPNISGADDDLVVGFLGRLSPHDRWRSGHRLQHVYMWILYGLLPIRWQFIDDFHSMIDPGIGITNVPRPAGWDQARFWLGKGTFFSLAFLVPLLAGHPLWKIWLVYVVSQFTLGLVLATVFQLAHCVEEATFPAPAERIERDWTSHQLDTTVDFARGNRLVTWYVGGLNFQVEHHLYPQICHIHYPALAAIVEEVSAAHGVPYRVNDRLGGAIGSHFRWLRRMGAQPEPAV